MTGLGGTGHCFFSLAQKLIAKYHVYGITRRGFGLSSTPDPTNVENYSADRLGDDVVAVLDALKLQKPILAGASIAGEELSSVASRYPQRIAAVIYLDAAYGYAYYSAAHPSYEVDAAELRRKLARMVSTDGPAQKPLVDDMLQTTLPAFQKSLAAYQKQLAALPPLQPLEPLSPLSEMEPVSSAIIRAEQRYTHIPVPVLAIFAVPHDMSQIIPGGSAAVAAAEGARHDGHRHRFCQWRSASPYRSAKPCRSQCLHLKPRTSCTRNGNLYRRLGTLRTNGRRPSLRGRCKSDDVAEFEPVKA